MKINSVTYCAFKANPTSFGQNEQKEKSISLDNKALACGVGLIAFVGVAGLIISKNKKSGITKVFDNEFKNSIQKSLQKEGINVQATSLSSIVGPEEFSQLVKKIKPTHFRAGLQTSKSDIPLEKFYKNAIKGDFRVSLHTHSNFSDGKATPEEFLECARKYADKAYKEITEQYKNFADKNGMFLSGGTDCHEKQIFSREPKISQDLLENKILK